MPTFREDTKLGTMIPLIKTDDIDRNAITNDKLADDSVGADQIQRNSIYTKHITSGSVTTDKLDEESVTTEKIADEAIVEGKIADGAVTTDKIGKIAVTAEKIDADAIKNWHLTDGIVTEDKLNDEAVTTEKIMDESVTTDKIANANVTTEKLANNSVVTEKIMDKSVTNEKLAQNTLTIDKFDPELRSALEAATGLPENLVELIQDVDLNLAKLNDTVYPITLGFTVTPNVSTMQTVVEFSVKSEDKPFVPDTLNIMKVVNNSTMRNVFNTPSASGATSTPIEGNKEEFRFLVTKQGRTGKSTSTTRYLCYYGGSSSDTANEDLLNALTKVSTTGVSFNPKLTTKDNDYIWLVVPSYLTINRVTSAGFDVPLSTPQTVTNSLGSFKAYRTANALTANTWNLVIS